MRSKTYRVALTLAILACLAFGIRLTVAFTRYSKVEHSVASVQKGDSRTSVILKIGKPNYYSGKCGVIHVPDKDCALEYVYSHPFAPFVPEYHIISFAADDRVIESEEWDSP